MEVVLVIVVLYLVWEAREKRRKDMSVLQEICHDDIGKECTIKRAISGSKVRGELLDVERDWVKIRATKGNRSRVRLLRVSDIKELQFEA